MKLAPLQISFLVSIACHAVAVGVVAVIGSSRKPVTAVGDTPPVVLTIIAETAEAEIESPPASVVREETASPPEREPPAPVPEPIVATPSPPEPLVQPDPPQPVAVAVAALDLLPTSQETEAPAVALPAFVPGPRAEPVVAAPSGTVQGSAAASRNLRTQPRYRKNPEPVYPPRARRLGLEGLVLLEVKVNPQGRAVEVTIKESSGHDILDQAALKAVRDWEFEPTRLGEIPLESYTEVPVRFQLVR